MKNRGYNKTDTDYWSNHPKKGNHFSNIPKEEIELIENVRHIRENRVWYKVNGEWVKLVKTLEFMIEYPDFSEMTDKEKMFIVEFP